MNNQLNSIISGEQSQDKKVETSPINNISIVLSSVSLTLSLISCILTKFTSLINLTMAFISTLIIILSSTDTKTTKNNDQQRNRSDESSNKSVELEANTLMQTISNTFYFNIFFLIAILSYWIIINATNSDKIAINDSNFTIRDWTTWASPFTRLGDSYLEYFKKRYIFLIALAILCLITLLMVNVWFGLSYLVLLIGTIYFLELLYQLKSSSETTFQNSYYKTFGICIVSLILCIGFYQLSYSSELSSKEETHSFTMYFTMNFIIYLALWFASNYKKGLTYTNIVYPIVPLVLYSGWIIVADIFDWRIITTNVPVFALITFISLFLLYNKGLIFFENNITYLNLALIAYIVGFGVYIFKLKK